MSNKSDQDVLKEVREIVTLWQLARGATNTDGNPDWPLPGTGNVEFPKSVLDEKSGTGRDILLKESLAQDVLARVWKTYSLPMTCRLSLQLSRHSE